MDSVKVKVNGTELEGLKNIVIATDGSMRLSIDKGKKTLDAISKMFSDNAKIEVITGNETTAIYYNKAVNSVKLDVKTNVIEVYLSTTALQESVEEEINGRVDTSDGAIEELAGMAADHEGRITSLEEQIAALISASETKTQESVSEDAENVSEDAESVSEITESGTEA